MDKICKVVAFLILGLEIASYRLRQPHPSLHLSSTENKNLVTSEAKAREILIRYGYLRCHWKRVKHLVAANTNQPKSCSKRQFREAIKRYQRIYNLFPTGNLDGDTLKHMSMSRCGNPDNETSLLIFGHRRRHNKRHPNSVLPPFRRRNKRSTEDNISGRSGTVLSRRRLWVQEYIKKLEYGEIDNISEKEYQLMKRARRRKRSTSKRKQEKVTAEIVSWRLVNSAYSNQLTANIQRAALALAFRMWSEVIPLVFREDTKSPVDDVHILLAFGRGEHLNCQNHFDGYGGQLSHAINTVANSEIHLDDDEFLTIGSNHGTNLIKVAVHEVGHALGLYHTSHNYSIMHAVYSQLIPNNNFELDKEDRKMVQKLYGVCKGRFDTAFDWVRSRSDGKFIYNTFFFRKNYYWMYENRHNRTRYGDPRSIETGWKGLPISHIDGYAHVWTITQNSSYFFKGQQYWLYNADKNKVASGYPRNISEDFRAMAGSKFNNVPDNLDSVYFDQRDGNLYFFKGNLVYGYDISRGKEGCCLPGYPRFIKKEFPSVDSKSHLPSNLDAVYFSYTDLTVYFFKGNRYWQNIGFNLKDKRKINKIIGPWEISSKWYDICEVDL